MKKEEKMRCTVILLLSLVLASLASSVSAAQVNIMPRASLTNPGITFKTKFGQVNATNNQIYTSLGVYSNGSIIFTPSPFERTVGTYTFTVNSYGNGTLTILFYGIPPVAVKGSGFSQSYDFTRNVETVTYSTSQTSGLAIVYSGVGPNIANAVTTGSGLLVMLVLLIATAFILILMVRVKAVANSEKIEDKGLARLITYVSALLGVALVFLVILALLSLFTPYFKGIGV